MKISSPQNWSKLLEKRLSDYPIKRKITALFAIAGVGVAFIGSALFIAFEWAYTRNSQIDSVRSLAEVAAYNATVLLDFESEEEERLDLLHSFDGKNSIFYSSILDENGALFAELGRSPKVSEYDLNPTGMTRIDYLSASMEVLEPVFRPTDRLMRNRNPETLDNSFQPIGYVYIVTDLSGFYKSIMLKTGTFLLLFLVAGFVVFAISARFSRLITTPILELAKTAKLISREQDFAHRQKKLYDDETGDLVDAFNEMIEQIQMREEIIRSNEDRFRAYFELGVVGMSILDNSGRFVNANNQLVKILGSSTDEVLQSSFDDWVSVFELEDDEEPILFKNIKERCEPSFSAELWLKTKSYGEVYTIVSARKLLKFDEEKPIYLLLFQDITDRKRSEEELLLSKQAAEEANRSKDEFLSVMSHELRTPLNPILGFVDLLLRIDKDTERRNMLLSIRKSSEHLLALITDVLEFTRAQAGRLEPVYGQFALDTLIGDVVEMMRRSGSMKGMVISIRNIDTRAIAGEMNLISDSGKIRQLLLNLLSNGVKYNRPGGSVWVDATVERTERGKLELSVVVEDSGVGIEESKLDYIFEPFTQLDMSLQRAHEGVGLGLSICKRIIDCLRGELTVSSEVGKGSIFKFKIPVVKGEVSIRSEPTASDSLLVRQSEADSRILLVEDDVENKALIETILRRMGIAFDWVSNGMEAMEKLKDSKFDLVLMDIRMPIMDGLEATRRFRSIEKSDIRTPIVAMTAHASKKIQTECVNAGMDGYLAKPVEYEKLKDYVNRYM